VRRLQVEFEDNESANKAFAEGQKGMVVDGREIRVDWATQRDPNPEGRAKAFGDKRNPPAPTLWVGNLSFDSTEDAIWEAFSDHGKVSNVRMPLDRDTGAVKGFAYVEFASTEDAGKALEGLNGKDIGGRNCRIGQSLIMGPHDALIHSD
jgi:nucleolin